MSQTPKLLKATVRVPVRTKYLLYLPDGYRGSKTRWPLMLFLHGAGECGSNLDAVAAHGPPKLVADGKQKFPFVLVSPQCPCGVWWNNTLQVESLGKLLDDIVTRYRIDRKRIYVTGLSMGGFGTWSLAARFPRRFAAIAPICGGGNPAAALRFAQVPTWVFHGAKDGTVLLKESQNMVKALRKAGGTPKFTIYPEAGHDAWSATYNNPAFYAWLLKQSR